MKDLQIGVFLRSPGGGRNHQRATKGRQKRAASVNRPRIRQADFRCCGRRGDRSSRISATARTKARLARLEWPIDVEIARYPRFGTRPIRSISGGASNAAWRPSASASLIQPTSRARARGSYGCSMSWPRAGRPCANVGAAISAGCPRRGPPWDCISSGRRQFAVPDPRWPRADCEPVAVAFPRPLARYARRGSSSQVQTSTIGCTLQTVTSGRDARPASWSIRR